MTINLLQELKDAVREEYDKEQRKGIHISDLVLCLRKAVRNRLDPAPLTDLDLRNFNQGRSHHQTVQQLAKRLKKKGHEVVAEKEKYFNDIVGHMDLLIDGNLPVEVKTTRQRNATPSDHYYTQLRYYMALMGTTKGKIIVESYNAEETPWTETDVTFMNGEIEMNLQQINEKKGIFKNALDKKDWLLAPPINIKDPKENWLCRKCPYKTPCHDYENSIKK